MSNGNHPHDASKSVKDGKKAQPAAKQTSQAQSKNVKGKQATKA